MFKWLLAVGGFFLFGRSFFGGVLGFFIGSGIDNYQNIMNRAQAQGGGRGQQGRAFTPEDLFNYYQQRSSSNDIPTMLMALSAAVMRADGKVLKSELTYVKSFLNQQFGNQFSTQHLQVLKRFLDSGNIPLRQICQDIKLRMQPEVRTQLLHYMFGIAKADGDVSHAEIDVIKQIAGMLGVSSVDFESVKNMFYRNVDSDYKVLGVESTASDDEVKKAYRKMAIKFHPDKVAQMGEQYQKGAKEKFQQIQDSYEAIKKRRGIK
ncbi:MAG: TerB family tellurite resistance protein [Crocinitomicaceae bacterium]|nr:TerB family tellurite resistance protein [Crocinitomicaceae bacterium]